MSSETSSVEQKCQAAIERVGFAIRNHEQNVPEDLSIAMLKKSA